MWPELGLNPHRWDDERFRVLKVISGLNHYWILFYLYYNLRRKIVMYKKKKKKKKKNVSKLQHNGDLTTSRTCIYLFIIFFLLIYLFIIFWRPFLIFLVMFMTVRSIDLQIMSMWQWRNVATLRFWRRHISRAMYSVSVYPILYKNRSLGKTKQDIHLIFSVFIYSNIVERIYKVLRKLEIGRKRPKAPLALWTLNWKCPVKVGWMWSGNV